MDIPKKKQSKNTTALSLTPPIRIPSSNDPARLTAPQSAAEIAENTFNQRPNSIEFSPRYQEWLLRVKNKGTNTQQTNAAQTPPQIDEEGEFFFEMDDLEEMEATV